MKESSKASAEQLRFASILQRLSLVGLIYLVLGFILYVSGILPSFVSPEEVAGSWHLPIREFLLKTNMPTGWGWIFLLNYADIISFGSIAFLAVVSTICFIIVLPSYFKKSDIFAYVILLQVIVLLLAASGIFSTGH